MLCPTQIQHRPSYSEPIHTIASNVTTWCSVELIAEHPFLILSSSHSRRTEKTIARHHSYAHSYITSRLYTTTTHHTIRITLPDPRTVIRTYPHTAPVVQTATEKLRPYLFSADRNLRYLGLETVDDFLKKNGNVPIFKDNDDLHEKILESIEEVDTSIRGAALRVLDKIVSKELFPKIAEKLLQMSVDNTSAAEYVKTLLSMGEADQYALVEDFGWYLLTLAELAKRKHAPHLQAVADQFADVAARVEAVRPYAVGVAQILLAAEEKGVGGGAFRFWGKGAKCRLWW